MEGTDVMEFVLKVLKGLCVRLSFIKVSSCLSLSFSDVRCNVMVILENPEQTTCPGLL